MVVKIALKSTYQFLKNCWTVFKIPMYSHMQPFPTRTHSEKLIFKFFPVLFILLFSPLLNRSPKRLHWSQGKHWEGKAPLLSQRQCSVKQDSWTQALGRARSISHWYFCAFTQNSAALSAPCTVPLHSGSQGPRNPMQTSSEGQGSSAVDPGSIWPTGMDAGPNEISLFSSSPQKLKVSGFC